MGVLVICIQLLIDHSCQDLYIIYLLVYVTLFSLIILQSYLVMNICCPYNTRHINNL